MHPPKLTESSTCSHFPNTMLLNSANLKKLDVCIGDNGKNWLLSPGTIIIRVVKVKDMYTCTCGSKWLLWLVCRKFLLDEQNNDGSV